MKEARPATISITEQGTTRVEITVRPQTKTFPCKEQKEVLQGWFELVNKIVRHYNSEPYNKARLGMYINSPPFAVEYDTEAGVILNLP